MGFPLALMSAQLADLVSMLTMVAKRSHRGNDRNGPRRAAEFAGSAGPSLIFGFCAQVFAGHLL
jgi:hypothetical protein